MIKSFGSRDTGRPFRRERVKRFGAIERQALRKLVAIHAANSLQDLAAVPGNRLEKLKGSRQEQRSIRINDPWRICFVWRGGDAYGVEVTDYHD